jgi:hypothetical protein
VGIRRLGRLAGRPGYAGCAAPIVYRSAFVNEVRQTAGRALRDATVSAARVILLLNTIFLENDHKKERVYSGFTYKIEKMTM